MASLENFGKPGPEVIKKFVLISSEHEIFPANNVKMPTVVVVGILTFMSRKNSTLGLFEPEKCYLFGYFYCYEHLKFHAQLS